MQDFTPVQGGCSELQPRQISSASQNHVFFPFSVLCTWNTASQASYFQEYFEVLFFFSAIELSDGLIS